MTQTGQEHFLFYLFVGAQGFQVFVNQFLTQAVRIVGLGLPEERSHVVIQRSFPPSLEINQVRLSVLHHDITALEVTIHEYRLGFHALYQCLAKSLEIVF